MTKLQQALAVPTYRNTRFCHWWPMLNAELAKMGEKEACFQDAQACYEMGESPGTAAAQLAATR